MRQWDEDIFDDVFDILSVFHYHRYVWIDVCNLFRPLTVDNCWTISKFYKYINGDIVVAIIKHTIA